MTAFGSRFNHFFGATVIFDLVELIPAKVKPNCWLLLLQLLLEFIKLGKHLKVPLLQVPDPTLS